VSSTFGRLFRVTTFGESHGAAVGVLVDGLPPGLAVDVEAIQQELDRRRPGQSAITTQRKEADQVEVLSGVYDGRSLGSPIAMLVRNSDMRSKDYDALKEVFRPGHADYATFAKYGVRDHRGGGRSSGRETVGRVAAGALAKAALATVGVRIMGGTVRVGSVEAHARDWTQVEMNAVRCPDANAAQLMQALIERARKLGHPPTLAATLYDAYRFLSRANAPDPKLLDELTKVAARQKLTLVSIAARSSAELEVAFGAIAKKPPLVHHSDAPSPYST